MTKRCIYCGIIFSGFLISACTSQQKQRTETEHVIHSAFLNNVETVTATTANQRTQMTLTGKIISDPDKTISYTPLISGIVSKAYFTLGDKVRKGEVLMDVRSTELSSLEAELIALESEVAVNNRELETARSMYADGMLSERELLEAEGNARQATAALSKVRADMDVYGSSKGNGIFSITAPMDGYIISKEVASGSTLSADSDPVFTIADLTSVWVIANVYASNLLYVKEGMDVSVSTLSYPNQQFPGKINSLSQVFDPEDKALKARIVMENKELKLKPEMSVVIQLHEELPNELVAVPSQALIFDEDTYFVIVQELNNSFSIKEVIPQGHNADVTYLNAGIKEGDKVVVKNQLLIYSELKGNG